LFNHLVNPQSLWQATKHEPDAGPVGKAQANAPEVFSCESSVDRESKCPISSRQHYCKGLDGFLVARDELRLSGLIGWSKSHDCSGGFGVRIADLI
jgi:hypothetical protein